METIKELLQNETVMLAISCVASFIGTISALVVALKKLRRATAASEANSSEFKVASEELKQVKAERQEMAQERQELAELREYIKNGFDAMSGDLRAQMRLIAKRQEIAYCNMPELVKSGAAKAIMEASDDKAET